MRNVQILIVFAVKICKQRMQTASASEGLLPQRSPTRATSLDYTGEALWSIALK